MRTAFSVLILTAMLAGCGGNDAAPQGENAKGDVLEASVSDDMIPLDTVRSQPPLADGEEIAEGEEEAGEGEAADAED